LNKAQKKPEKTEAQKKAGCVSMAEVFFCDETELISFATDTFLILTFRNS